MQIDQVLNTIKPNKVSPLEADSNLPRVPQDRGESEKKKEIKDGLKCVFCQNSKEINLA